MARNITDKSLGARTPIQEYQESLKELRDSIAGLMHKLRRTQLQRAVNGEADSCRGSEKSASGGKICTNSSAPQMVRNTIFAQG